MTSLVKGQPWSWRRLVTKSWSWPLLLRPGTHERRCGLAWLAVALGIWAWVDVRPRAEIEVDRPWEHQTDLTVYTEAGAAFFDGRPPYEVTNLRGWRYLYPPLLAMLLAPLHQFDSTAQALIWFAVNVVLAWACVREAERLAARCLAPATSAAERHLLLPAITIAALLATTLPTLNCLQRGQIGVLKLYFLMLGFRWVCDARAWPKILAGGAALAFAVAIKITPLLPAAFVVGQLAVQAWRHPRRPFARGRAWGSAAGIGLGLLLYFFAAPAALVGWQANLRHVETWRRDVLLKFSDTGHDDFAGNPHSLRNQSLGNAVYRLGNCIAYEFIDGPDDRRLDEHGYDPGATSMDNPVVGRMLGVTRLAILALLAVFGVRMGRRSDATGQAVGFGLACVATLVLSPVARAHYFMLWLPAVIAAPIWLWRHHRFKTAIIVAATPAVVTMLHYLVMSVAGRIGLLGFGTTFWFLGTIASILATDRRHHSSTHSKLPTLPHFRRSAGPSAADRFDLTGASPLSSATS